MSRSPIVALTLQLDLDALPIRDRAALRLLARADADAVAPRPSHPRRSRPTHLDGPCRLNPKQVTQRSNERIPTGGETPRCSWLDATINAHLAHAAQQGVSHDRLNEA